jgi:hypothetical protein
MLEELPSRYDDATNSFIQLLNETKVCITQALLHAYDLGFDEVKEEVDYEDGERSWSRSIEEHMMRPRQRRGGLSTTS